MGNINPGYRGYLDVDTIGMVRFADSSITARQTIEAPDIIMADHDHDAYAYGKIECGGTVSGPVTQTFINGGGTGLLAWACTRIAPCGTLAEHDVAVNYYCSAGGGVSKRTFSSMIINSMGFSCAAGDIAQFNLDFIGKNAGTWSSDTTSMTTAEKLLTWDKVTVAITAGDSTFDTLPVAYSNFDFTVNNNCTPAYSLGQSNLFPYEIVPGLRTITGTISAYNVPTSDGVISWDDYTADGVGSIIFNIGGVVIAMNVRWHRVEPASSTGPMISTLGFTGVSHQSGSIWG